MRRLDMLAVIGASGFLGSYLVREILETTEETVVAAARRTDCLPVHPRVIPLRCDVTDARNIAALADTMRGGGPCKVFWLAAYHNIDLVAQNPDTARAVNITALGSFLNSAAESISLLLFASTDCVYGEGSADVRFREGDPLEPVNLYGAQKAEAEALVNAHGGTAARLPFLFGPSLTAKKHFYDVLSENMKAGKKTDTFTDSLRSSLDYGSAAALLVRLAQSAETRSLPKAVNVCGDDDLSKYDLGLMLADKLGVPREAVVPVTSAAGGVFRERRALAALMDNGLLKSILGINKIKIKI